jgi:threonine/homoserine/homoserine lactone efflux protein
MAVTGESYIDSAKSTISLIFDNFWLFMIIDIISTMLKLTGIIFICAIPGIIGFLLLQATAQNPNDSTFLSLGTVIIVLASMLIAVLFLSILS